MEPEKQKTAEEIKDVVEKTLLGIECEVRRVGDFAFSLRYMGVEYLIGDFIRCKLRGTDKIRTCYLLKIFFRDGSTWFSVIFEDGHEEDLKIDELRGSVDDEMRKKQDEIDARRGKTHGNVLKTAE